MNLQKKVGSKAPAFFLYLFISFENINMGNKQKNNAGNTVGFLVFLRIFAFCFKCMKKEPFPERKGSSPAENFFSLPPF